MAGKRKGTEDSRHLWPEMLRAIRECRPTWIVGENVPGLINWSGGLVFEQVCIDLESEGYEVQPVVLPASGVNAPHRRDRVWFVAYLSSKRINGINGHDNEQTGENRKWDDESDSIGSIRPTQNPNDDGRGGDERNNANTINKRLQRRKNIGGIAGSRTESNKQPSRLFRTDWSEFPTQPPLRSRNDGFSPDMDNVTFFKQLGINNPRQPAISFSKWRNESIKAGGNAIVPQVVYQIFKVIEEMQNSQNQ